MTLYQPRFVLYARAHGMDPRDAPGGHRYINWINARWSQWNELVGHDGRHHDDADHADFDAWLERWVGGTPVVESTQQGEMFA